MIKTSNWVIKDDTQFLQSELVDNLFLNSESCCKSDKGVSGLKRTKVSLIENPETKDKKTKKSLIIEVIILINLSTTIILLILILYKKRKGF